MIPDLQLQLKVNNLDQVIRVVIKMGPLRSLLFSDVPITREPRDICFTSRVHMSHYHSYDHLGEHIL